MLRSEGGEDPRIDTREKSEIAIDPRAKLSGKLTTEGGADPCTDSRDKAESGADLFADNCWKSDMETRLDSCPDSGGELLGVGGPCTEPKGEPDTEGEVNPSSDTGGVLLGGGGAGADILIKAGFTGEMDPCTDPLKVLVGLGVSPIDIRVEPGAECKVVCRGNRGDLEGWTDPCTDTRGELGPGLEAEAASSVVVGWRADIRTLSFRPRVPKPQMSTLRPVSVLKPKPGMSWEGALKPRVYLASAAVDVFDRRLECWWEVNHSELVFQEEDEATPAMLAASGIWAGRFPTPGERCNSRSFPPRRPLLKGAAELGALIDPERGAGEEERGWGRCSTLFRPSLRGARLSRTSWPGSALLEPSPGSQARYGAEKLGAGEAWLRLPRLNAPRVGALLPLVPGRRHPSRGCGLKRVWAWPRGDSTRCFYS